MLSRLLPLAALLVALPLGAQTQRAENVAVGGSGMGGPAGPFTFYSLAENRVVPNADSASTAWDLALRGTTILVNGGTSGPGEGRAAIVEAPYDDVTSVAEADLRADGEGDCPRGANAICTGSGNGWYLYESATVSQIEGRTIVVRPATGGTPVKMRVLSYVLSDPQPDGSRPRFYTFEYEALAPEAGSETDAGTSSSHDGH